MTQTPPPEAPKATKADLELFRGRLRALLSERKLSARSVERDIGIATGTLSKVYAGKMPLTHRLLHELALLLNVEPFKLVEGIAFEHLLHSAIATPASEEMARLRTELDTLRVEKRAAEDALTAMRKELETARRGHDEVELKADRLETQAADIARDLASERAEVERLRGTVATLEQAKQAALASGNHERQQRVEALARVSAFEQNAEQWRKHGVERDERVTQLEAYVAFLELGVKHLGAKNQQLTAKANDTTAVIAGSAIGGVLGFVLGAVSSSGGSSGGD